MARLTKKNRWASYIGVHNKESQDLVVSNGIDNNSFCGSGIQLGLLGPVSLGLAQSKEPVVPSLQKICFQPKQWMLSQYSGSFL